MPMQRHMMLIKVRAAPGAYQGLRCVAEFDGRKSRCGVTGAFFSRG
jgi:hypothetical protein